MARKVFFSFKYDDVSRAMVVRNSWVTKGSAAGFIDKAEFEEVERKGDKAIQNWIDNQIEGTSVTVVLVGEKTLSSRWVNYEIKKSVERGNGLLFIDISQIKDLQGNTSTRDKNFPNNVQIYLWFKNDGYNNIGNWIESAAKEAGR